MFAVGLTAGLVHNLMKEYSNFRKMSQTHFSSCPGFILGDDLGGEKKSP